MARKRIDRSQELDGDEPESMRLTWYCVMRLRDGALCYKGVDEELAAEAMEPGTVFGKGIGQDAAVIECLERYREATMAKKREVKPK